jgi:superfamily II DNA or RNA helicase
LALFRRLSIGNSAYAHYDTFVLDHNNTLVYASIIGYDALIKDMSKEVNKVNNIYLESLGYCRTVSRGYEVDKRKQNNSDFSHLVVYRKDKVMGEDTPQERLLAYIFYRNEQEKFQAFYDKIYKNTSVPVLMEWIPYIIESASTNNNLRRTTIYYDNTDEKPKPFECLCLDISKEQLLNIVQNGLRTGAINVRGSNETSEQMTNINGLDSYLNSFGETLARRIQQSFTPKFIPGQSTYDSRVDDFDDACFCAGIEMFDAQKDVIQASVTNLKTSKINLVIGEMGCGKTLIGAGIPYAHYGRTGSTTVILCPAHLTNKWKREIERLVPNGEAYIVKHVRQVMKLDKRIRDKHKKKNLYLIMSKETAKFGYESRPSAIWSISKNTFVCPECGQPLTKSEYVGEGRSRHSIQVKFNKTDMSRPLAHNQVCPNKKRVWNKTIRKWEEVDCKAKLWTPLNGDDDNIDWVKLGAEGWILKSHITSIFNEMAAKTNLTRKEATFFAKLAEKKVELDTGGEISSSSKAPRKFPLAKYIRENYKGVIDYLIADELHLYKGDTEQGQAFGDLALAANKVIGLTGTLLNGYADGLFYILYRTIAPTMQKEGFEYSDEQSFMKCFGVMRSTNRFTIRNGREDRRVGSGSEKRLPGVSPLVFTKFLLENAVFLSLSDMAEGLPSYEEIPIAVEMDEELRNAYNTLEQDLRQSSSWRGNGGMKIMGSLLQTLSVYPDQPYDQPPVVHPDTGQVLVVPPSLNRGLRNKESRLMDLVNAKVEQGEKVLIYYQWTNKTDVAEKVTDMLREDGLNVAVLTASVSPEKREEWIDNRLKEGIDVLICNPTLVETGLDLLPFTTIIFYQVGYNIFTMRQASRRSWRLSQTHSIEVFFLYYTGTIQEQALSLMATKLQASMAIEGKFSEEGLRAMSNNEDLLTQIANSVVNGIRQTVDAQVFRQVSIVNEDGVTRVRTHRKTLEDLIELDSVDNIVDIVNKPAKQLEYLYRKTTPMESPTPTHKIMLGLFNKSLCVGNL